jgi:hypothetical protein
MITDILDLLKKLGIEERGTYEDEFYVVKLKDSDAFGEIYGRLDGEATNLGDPSIGVNTNDTTTDITGYFEADMGDVTYKLYLTADFADDIYELRIKEKAGDGERAD